jgi:muramidase (phage lysozyme)
MRQAACIRAKESGGRWHIRNSPYGGAYQFVDSTWTRFAPRRWPMSFSASPAQQTLVAHRVWVANGHRWGGSQWPLSSRACGVA